MKGENGSNCLQSAWTDSLFFTPRDTGSATGLFHDFTLDTTSTRRVQSRNLEYSGEVILASTWRLDYGLSLPKNDTHFRLVILTAEAVQSVKPEHLQDPRIAVVLPGGMTEEARDAAAAYVAWHSLAEEFQHQTGRQAEEIRSWLDSQKQSIYAALTATHLKLYQAGWIVTRDNLGINARDAFGQGGDNDKLDGQDGESRAGGNGRLPLGPPRGKADPMTAFWLAVKERGMSCEEGKALLEWASGDPAKALALLDS